MSRNNRVEELRAEDPSAARFKCFYVVYVQRMRFRYNFYEKKKFSDRSDRSNNNRLDRKSSISAIVVAAIAGEWFPYDRCDR